jgi:hypothetical protein
LLVPVKKFWLSFLPESNRKTLQWSFNASVDEACLATASRLGIRASLSAAGSTPTETVSPAACPGDRPRAGPGVTASGRPVRAGVWVTWCLRP